jgi:hypothetical protein
MFRLIQVNEHQRGLWFRRGEFQDLIEPGSTWLLSWQDRIDIIDTRVAPRLTHPLLSKMLDNSRLRDQLQVIRLAEMQRAFVWIDGRFEEVLGPGCHAYWKTDAKLNVEMFSLFDESSFTRNRMSEYFDSPRC